MRARSSLDAALAIVLAGGALRFPVHDTKVHVSPYVGPCHCPHRCSRHAEERLARASARREAKRLRRLTRGAR